MEIFIQFISIFKFKYGELKDVIVHAPKNGGQ